MSPGADPLPPQPPPPAASPATGPPLPPNPLAPKELWLDDLRRAAEAQRSWLWHGFLAPGAVTLLTSQWKAGKTTLLSVLLARLKAGGQLAGLPVAAGKAAVVTEEPPGDWLKRGEKLDYGDHLCWFCRPFAGKPRPEQWLALLDRLAEIHSGHGLSLVAIDPLAAFFPGRGENCAEIVLEFLMTLRRLTSLGISVFLLHHPGKEEKAPGLAARGSGALGAFADVLLELKWYARPDDDDRRRRLVAFSRFEETPRQMVIEWTADGTDYVSHGTFLDEEFTLAWKALHAILEAAPKKLSRGQLARRWPPAAEPPGDVTLWRWLGRAVTQGLLQREGTGRRGDPYRYWLPGQEEKWKRPPWQDELDSFIERFNREPEEGQPPSGAPGGPSH